MDGSDTVQANLYGSYASDTEIMTGIIVSKDSDDNKGVIKYARKLEIVDVAYNDWSGNLVHGFGLKKMTNGLPYSQNWANVPVVGIHSGSSARSRNYPDYFKHLKEAGLYIGQAGNPTPVHDASFGTNANTNTNVNSNG